MTELLSDVPPPVSQEPEGSDSLGTNRDVNAEIEPVAEIKSDAPQEIESLAVSNPVESSEIGPTDEDSANKEGLSDSQTEAQPAPEEPPPPPVVENLFEDVEKTTTLTSITRDRVKVGGRGKRPPTKGLRQNQQLLEKPKEPPPEPTAENEDGESPSEGNNDDESNSARDIGSRLGGGPRLDFKKVAAARMTLKKTQTKQIKSPNAAPEGEAEPENNSNAWLKKVQLKKVTPLDRGASHVGSVIHQPPTTYAHRPKIAGSVIHTQHQAVSSGALDRFRPISSHPSAHLSSANDLPYEEPPSPSLPPPSPVSKISRLRPKAAPAPSDTAEDSPLPSPVKTPLSPSTPPTPPSVVPKAPLFPLNNSPGRAAIGGSVRLPPPPPVPVKEPLSHSSVRNPPPPLPLKAESLTSSAVRSQSPLKPPPPPPPPIQGRGSLRPLSTAPSRPPPPTPPPKKLDQEPPSSPKEVQPPNETDEEIIKGIPLAAKVSVPWEGPPWARDSTRSFNSAPKIPTLRPQWIPDTSVDNCLICATAFGLFSRRHHCRTCGGIFCYNCSQSKCILKDLGYGTSSQKVCINCVKFYRLKTV
jgi:hypothetical protein